MKRRLLSFAAACALSGCVVGPEYRKPAVPTAALEKLPFLPAGASDTSTPDDWWNLFKDQTLTRLVEQALRANADIRVAEANLDAARASFQAVRNARLPATTENVGTTYGRTVAQTQIADALGRKADDGWLNSGGFELAYEVDLFGRVRRSQQAARADMDTVQADRDAVRLLVAAETSRAYMAICAISQQIEVASTSIDIARQQNVIAGSRFEAGATTAYYVAGANTVLARARATLPVLQGERRAAIFALSALLGGTPGEIPPGVEQCRDLPRLREPVPVGDGGELLRRRPDIRRAERKIAAATARIGVAQADLFPRITLLGSVTTAAPEVVGLGSRPATSFGLGPFITWSFPNLGVARARIHAARAQDRAALADYDGTVLTALKEVEQALARYEAANERERELGQASASAQTAFDLAGKQFDAGAISRLDVLVAEQTLVDARSAAAAAATQRLDLLISLFKALGGGWKTSG